MRTDPIAKAINTDIATLETFDLAAFGRRLHAAVQRDRRHPSTPDGMPDHTIGASDPTPIVAPPRVDQHGQPIPAEQPVTLTPTERAAAGRSHPPRDEHRDLTKTASRNLTAAVAALAAAQAALDKLDDIRDNHDGTSTEPGCRALARIGAWEPIYRRTTFQGESWPLGEWAYKFLLRVERMPTIDECAAHARGQRVMVKAS